MRSQVVVTMFVLVSFFCSASSMAQQADQVAKYLAGDGGSFHRFGISVGLENGLVAIGSQSAEPEGTSTGAVYMFAAQWMSAVNILFDSSLSSSDQYGRVVALDGQRIVVGANRADPFGSSSGAAYLYDFSQMNPVVIPLIASKTVSGDQFGTSVDVYGDLVAVGADRVDVGGVEPGAAYLFDATTGAELGSFVPLDGNTSDTFGSSVCIGDDHFFVGARLDDDLASNSGAVYVFDLDTGAEIIKLTPPAGFNNGDFFGQSLAYEDGVLAIGADGAEGKSFSTGAVFIYDTKTWQLIHTLFDKDGGSADQFGYSVDIDQGRVAIGAQNARIDGIRQGAVFVFDLISGQQILKVCSTEPEDDSLFGSSVSLDGQMLLVGSNRENEEALDSGAAYLFEIQFPQCEVDLNGDGVLNFFDVSEFITRYLAGCP